MINDFTDVMSERTNEELVKITTIQRKDYQTEAVIAAEKELAMRNVNVDEIESTKEVIVEKQEIDDKLESRRVKSWVRLVHVFVDFIVIILMFVVVLGIFIDDMNPVIAEAILPILMLVFSFIYYIFMESKYQKTLGKMLMRTKVVMADGTTPEVSDIITRTFCRLIPFDRISFLFTNNGFHDRLSGTMVVKDVEM